MTGSFGVWAESGRPDRKSQAKIRVIAAFRSCDWRPPKGAKFLATSMSDSSGLLAAADELRDLDAEVILDHDDLAVGDELVVHVEADGVAGLLVELHDGAGRKLEDIAHRQQAGAKLHGHFDLYVEDDIKGFFFHGSGRFR